MERYTDGGAMRSAAVALGVVLCAATFSGEGRSVTFDQMVDFSSFNNFQVRDARISSSRPELSNQLFAKQVGDAVRTTLVAKGLSEASDHPDLVVGSSITGVD